MSDVPKEPESNPIFVGGQVTRQKVLDAADVQDFNVGLIGFSAGSKNRWHTHTTDQILIVTEGSGTVTTEQEGECSISVGDIVLIPAGQKHWHGAPGATPMTHLAITGKSSQTRIED